MIDRVVVYVEKDARPSFGAKRCINSRLVSCTFRSIIAPYASLAPGTGLTWKGEGVIVCGSCVPIKGFVRIAGKTRTFSTWVRGNLELGRGGPLTTCGPLTGIYFRFIFVGFCVVL